MTLKKARQTLNTHACGGKIPSEKDLRDAEFLGVEAIKFVEVMRQELHCPSSTALVGETEE